MTDIFIKILASNHIRLGMAITVVERMLLFKERLHLVIAEGSLHVPSWAEQATTVNVLPPENFHIGSKAFAEEQAKSDIYVVLDDDHLPIGADWVQKGIKALECHPDYACLSSWSINGEVPEGADQSWNDSHGDDFCWEAQCTGTPYFMRKGTLDQKRMPVGPLVSYDTVLSNHIRDKGKIGFLRQVRFNHLGYGFSQVIPGWWKA